MPADTPYIREDLLPFLSGQDPFTFFSSQDGEVYRALEFRRTYALVLGEKTFFVKYHSGSSIGEILKNLLQFRLPVLGARNERLALSRLSDLGIAVPGVAAFGVRGASPLSMQSFIVTDDVGTQENLEDLTRTWPQQPPSFTERLHLIRMVADIARTMHTNGICHRDFYLCHFMVIRKSENLCEAGLTLLDLHRALVKQKLGERWIIKDLAGLYFSAMDIGLGRKDLLRFVRFYSGKKLKRVLQEDGDFWKKVNQRATKMKSRLG